MIEKRIDEIFVVDEANETVRVSQEAPEELQHAIQEARDNVVTGAEFSVVDIGKFQRPLAYGSGEIRVFPVESASIFVREEPDSRIKMLSVGVSSNGPLTDDQVRKYLNEVGANARLTPVEMEESRRFSTAIRSLKQSRLFVDRNSSRLLLDIARLQEGLSMLGESDDELNGSLVPVEVGLHNLLSSVYTFHEAAKSSLSTLDVSREYRHHIQSYRDSVSTAIGLRHCVQHNITLKVHWVGKYSHDYEMFDFNIVIPIAEVIDPDLYDAPEYSDASGNKHCPVDYFYGGLSGRFIDLEQLAKTIRESTQNTYDQLKRELEDDDRVVNVPLESLEKIKKYYISDWQERES